MTERTEYALFVLIVVAGTLHAVALYREGLYLLAFGDVVLNVAFVLNVVSLRNCRQRMEAWRARCMGVDADA